ncbi:CPSF30 [Symbiodinium sp. CCMP2456]|nr:CPSF30 [Symbiodinium sp. CCMP2456]
MLREPPGFTRSPLVEDPRVRFFVITSNLGENVVKSVEHNVWATQRKNEDALTDAFHHSKAVILIFSVNKSGAFQGYARMRGLPGRSKCRSNPFGGYGRMFDVEWLRLQDVVMPEVSYLKNSLDGGREVGYARDGQELPASVGAELCRHFDVRVYLEDPKTYEPCVDDPQPVLPPPVRGADSTPRPGPPPATPPPHQPAHELPYHWPAPSYSYPGHVPPAGHPPPPQGYPPPTSPFSVAPSGLPPPWAVPPGAWLGHSGRHGRRRRRHRRRSSSYSQSPERSSKRRRGSDAKEEALPDFTKMTHEEYVEWWKKTHPTAPANATAASPPAEGVVEPSPPAPQASAPVPVSPFQAAAAPASQDPALAEPVQAVAEVVQEPATCFERSDPPVAAAPAAPAEPAKPQKEKKKKKKEAEAVAKAAAAPPTAANGATPVEPKPVKEKKAKKDKKEKKQKKNKEKTIVLNGDAEISGKDVVAPGQVSPPSAGASEAAAVAEMPKPIQANGKEISAAVAAVPQSGNSSVAAAARKSDSPSPKGKDVAPSVQSPSMPTSGDAAAPAASKSILRKSQASSIPSASESAAPMVVAPAPASAPPQPKSILRRPQATEVAAAVQKSQEARCRFLLTEALNFVLTPVFFAARQDGDTDSSGEHTKFSASISRQDGMSFRPTETRAVPHVGPQAEQHTQRAL